MSGLHPDQIAAIGKTREFLSRGLTSLSELQRITTATPEVKGKSWVSRQTCIAPAEYKEFISCVVYDAIKDLGTGDYKVEHIEVVDVDVRWTGYRPDASDDEPEPVLPENKKFENIMKDVEIPLTILYFIGGGYYMNNAARYHATTSKLAKMTGGRCISFSYRLSPQNTFPAALMDALLVYMCLLYPPPGSFHTAIPASSIVFAGDSAGANLALSLLQLILSPSGRKAKLDLHSQKQERGGIPCPAGVALLSAGLDMSFALSSWEANARYDIFSGGDFTFLKPNFTACGIWPSNPPRGHVYCDVSLLRHPLVSPCLSRSWKGSPPLWFCGGQEIMSDPVRLVVKSAASDDVPVVYEEYAEMPHDFPILGDNWPWAQTESWEQSITCMDHWAGICVDFYRGKEIQTVAEFIKTNCEKEALDIDSISKLTIESAEQIISKKMEGWKPWVGSDVK